MPVIKVSVLYSVVRVDCTVYRFRLFAFDTAETSRFYRAQYLTFRHRKRALGRRPRKKGNGRREVIVVRFRAFKGVESKKLSRGPDIYLLNCFLFGIVNLADVCLI